MHRPPTVSARGFSFVELLFAVAVMGIGFIMVAAIFPIGLQQTKLTLDETTAAAGARSMAARLQQLGSVQVQFATGPGNETSVMPITAPTAGVVVPTNSRLTIPGQVRTFNDPRGFLALPNTAARRNKIWQAVSSELINPSDSRNAVAVMYRSDVIGTNINGTTTYAGSGTAQIIAINAQIANDSQYQLATAALPINDLEPRPVAVQIIYDAANEHYVATFFSVTSLDAPGAVRGGYPTGTFTPGSIPWNSVLDAAVASVTEGAFVVISDDRVLPPSPSAGRLNGHILRLGARRPDLGSATNPTFDLAPGYDFTPDAGPDGIANNADDTVAIGVDSATSMPRSGLSFGPVTRGGQTYNGSGVVVGGSSANKGAVALVLGRGFANPNATPVVAADYKGLVQDVSAYTTFVTVPNR